VTKSSSSFSSLTARDILKFDLDQFKTEALSRVEDNALAFFLILGWVQNGTDRLCHLSDLVDGADIIVELIDLAFDREEQGC
jgi:hypothetical protein